MSKRNLYYHPCPYCGANLDPGERCECRDTLEQKNQTGRRHLADLINGRIDQSPNKDIIQCQKGIVK